MKIKHLLSMAAVMMSLVALVLCTIAYTNVYRNLIPTLAAGENDAQVINVAGRQRMLTQKMSKEALMVAAGISGAADLLKATRDEYAQNLVDLSRGNVERGISPPPSEAVSSDFAAVAQLWTPFNRAIEQVLAGSNQVDRGLAFIAENNIPLLKASNKAVQDWAVYSRARITSMEAQSETSFTVTLVVTLAAILLSVVAAGFILLRIMGPLNRVRQLVGEYALGNLSGTAQVVHNDELGEVTQAVNDMGAQLRDIVSTLTQRSDELRSAFVSVAGSAERLSDDAGELTREVNHASDSFTQLKISMDRINSSAYDAGNSVDGVAAALQQMSDTASDIAANATRERVITAEAQRNAQASREAMSKLGTSMDRVGAVVTLIGEIADQSKLLALNATIEAARAGQSGSGFSVVATEVKELARQTMEATKEIADIMGKIQSEAANSDELIKSMSETIEEVTQISSTVAVAVEEQSLVIADVSQNMNTANTRMKDVTANIQQTHNDAERILQGLEVAQGVASRAAEDSDATHSSAATVDQVSEQLSTIVSQFQVEPAHQL